MKPSGLFRGCLAPVNILDPTISTSYRQSLREQKDLQVRQFLLETNLGATEDIHEVNLLENFTFKALKSLSIESCC